MLDIKFIRENIEVVKKATQEKHLAEKVDVDEVIALDDAWKDLLRRVEIKRALKNQLSDDISKIEGEERVKLISEATATKEDLTKLEEELRKIESEATAKLCFIPNTIHPDVPFGKDESENVVIKTWGELPKFEFEVKDHVALGKDLDLIDTDTAGIVSGARFSYLKGGLVRMQVALMQFAFDSFTDETVIRTLANTVGNPSSKPFVPIIPPVLIRGEVAKKMDRLDPIDERYYFEKDELMFVGSAEHSLGPMFMDYVFEQGSLPQRFIGYSTAFRREAGSYGKDITGIFRVHQFDKMEFECFTTAENGGVEQDLLVAMQEYLVQQLKLPYKLMAICTGDMGKPDYRQIDINCWLPGQNTYRETHTSDYMTDYQARRLNTRYKTVDGKSEFVHMNDATCFAAGRLLIAIMENYQQKDGSIKVPDVLVSYMKGIKEIR